MPFAAPQLDIYAPTHESQSIVLELYDPLANNSEVQTRVTHINDTLVRAGEKIELPSNAFVVDLESGLTYVFSNDQSDLETGQTLLDTFRYTLTDNDGRETFAEAVIMISREHPVINVDDHFITTPINTPVTFPVVSPESNGGHEPSTVVLLNRPSSGKSFVLPDHTICFIPDPMFVGTATLHYLIEDGAGEFSDATTTIDVG